MCASKRSRCDSDASAGGHGLASPPHRESRIGGIAVALSGASDGAGGDAPAAESVAAEGAAARVCVPLPAHGAAEGSTAAPPVGSDKSAGVSGVASGEAAVKSGAARSEKRREWAERAVTISDTRGAAAATSCEDPRPGCAAASARPECDELAARDEGSAVREAWRRLLPPPLSSASSAVGRGGRAAPLVERGFRAQRGPPPAVAVADAPAASAGAAEAPRGPAASPPSPSPPSSLRVSGVEGASRATGEKRADASKGEGARASPAPEETRRGRDLFTVAPSSSSFSSSPSMARSASLASSASAHCGEAA
mmetsp:Transcript_39515/g.126963  ORF Transcript_39515/g.126963 Transcript_39515/m.126963 type:complete len:310 (-) Transcript_39515:101-1030(-)